MFDAAIDDRANEGDALDAAIAAACPNGINADFDNTAGPISDSVLNHPAVSAGHRLRHRFCCLMEPATAGAAVGAALAAEAGAHAGVSDV